MNTDTRWTTSRQSAPGEGSWMRRTLGAVHIDRTVTDAHRVTVEGTDIAAEFATLRDAKAYAESLTTR